MSAEIAIARLRAAGISDVALRESDAYPIVQGSGCSLYAIDRDETVANQILGPDQVEPSGTRFSKRLVWGARMSVMLIVAWNLYLL